MPKPAQPRKRKTILVGALDEYPQEMLAAIGLIIGKYSYLQHQLGVIIREIAKMPGDTGRAILVGAEIGVACRMLSTLTDSDRWVKDDNLRNDIRKLADEADKATRKERNKFAHGVFGVNAETRRPVLYLISSTANRREPSEEPITMSELTRSIQKVQGLWDRAQDATQRLKALR